MNLNHDELHERNLLQFAASDLHMK